MFRDKLMHLLLNKYGNDKLNMSLIILAVILSVLNLFITSTFVYFLQTLCLVFALVRFFSTNHLARSRENDKFIRIFGKLFNKNNSDHYNTVNQNGFSFNKHSNKKDPAYKYFKCPTCSAKLRVPKKKGRITITCPKCRTSFKGKS